MCRSNVGEKRRKTVATEEEENASKIPDDLYEEILVLLSTKDVLICKCVCKDWLKLISSPRFIQRHLCRSNGIRILIPVQSDIIDYCHFNSANAEDISNKIPYPLGISGKNASILGSCDGLICLVDTESCNLALFNPSTRKSVTRTVDEINFTTFHSYWFGYHPSCGQYVVILCYADMLHFKAVVYKFSGNLKLVLHCSVRHHRLVMCFQRIPVLLHGNPHWAAASYKDNNNSGSIILKYDLHKDETIEIPVPGRCDHFRVGVIHGCLFAILHKRNELWIMKEYGVEQSWIRYTNIEGYDNTGILSPHGFCSNEDLILEDVYRSRLTKYSFRNREVSLLKDYNAFSQPIVCVDSLVSPELISGNTKN